MSERGQSLVEVAIALPFLLIVLVGLVDLGRVFHYTIAVETGVREGAAYAARLVAPDDDAIRQRICEASGIATEGGPCDGLTLTEARVGGEGGGFVDVMYDLDLLFGHILRFADPGPVHLRATATFPSLVR